MPDCDEDNKKELSVRDNLMLAIIDAAISNLRNAHQVLASEVIDDFLDLRLLITTKS